MDQPQPAHAPWQESGGAGAAWKCATKQTAVRSDSVIPHQILTTRPEPQSLWLDTRLRHQILVDGALPDNAGSHGC
jgi:hypothetical protein